MKDLPQKREANGVQEFNARDTVNILQDAMKKITNEKLTAENIHAACNCAGKITDIMRVHLDFTRLQLQYGKKKL